MQRRRFTKTEAIAVISLAMIALSLLLLLTGPKHSQYYQHHGYGGDCFNSLNMLGHGSALYTIDNDGYRPGPAPSAKSPVWDIGLGTELGIPYSPTTWSGGTAFDKQLALFVCYADETAWMPAQKRFRVRLNDWRFSWGYIQS